MKIEIDYVNPEKDPVFIRRTVGLAEAIHEFDDQCIKQVALKQFNPVYRIARKLTGIKNFTKYQKVLAGNGKRQREAIYEYVQQRKRGERKSQVEDGADILSLFLANPEVFTDEFIVDELRDFFGAAVQTTQYGS